MLALRTSSVSAKWWIAAAVVVIAGGAVVVIGSGDGEPVFEAVFAQRGAVEHVVTVTGRVEPAERVNLSFSRGGQIAVVYVNEGDAVARGQALATLDTSILSAELAEADASVSEARAKLAELLAGSRTEEVAVSEAALAKAETQLRRAGDDLAGTLERAQALADDALRNDIDRLFDTPTTKPDFGVAIQSGSTEFRIEGTNQERLLLNDGRREAVERMAAWRQLLAEATEEDLLTRAEAVESHLLFLQRFFGDVAEVVNALSPDTSAAQTIYDSYKSDVANARATVSSLLGEVRATMETYDERLAARSVAERELTLARAEPTDEEIDVARAAVARAEAARARSAAELVEARITAPFAGVVSDRMIDAGEVVSAGEPVLTLFSGGAFELVANIPEADIARVALGDRAEVTLDAYEPTEVFAAEVVDIAPAETMLEGVATYKTTLRFVTQDPRIKSGMTADINILTDRVEDTIFVPQRTVIRSDDRVYVRVVDGDTFRERDVVTGLRGSNGTIEILEGLQEGEQVVLFVEEE